MLKRLSNDPSLARFSGQFVPLKLVTDGNPQWSRFSRKYPIESRAIPRLYVIRADGEQLYADVGSLPGNKLPQMLMTTLQRAGRILSEKEVLALEQAVAVAKPALEEDQLLAAATALADASKTVALDKLESFAKPATEATSAYSALETNLDDRLKKLFSELPDSANEQTFQTLVEIAEVNAAYKMFRPMRTKSKELALKLRKN